ncbi:extradiol ring-cleavage dioxygenase [Acidovorax sp. NCPPB 3859]|nr:MULTISPECIES: extradiol ring-cleavage dioxygenase [unclassified Acidovorax]MDA8449458.1 extradiol ring-cleavage dioxygenase [Acidovorax sp. GBBC 3297]MDA8458453.1 extradiol ring-cleavage dioxygenase [Acidovorax sp. GBBC 3333]MDA8463491.1 extradiol ring-cleavage dioxygenase [Acidovorax sp. GBBC 3332]MDA8468638.1 extradiol ring-cleavage dioxygenase [Acidovorax sp. GBBC 3299]WCM76994.1 extradiol ring-cleavage dioxygenase [Acidovorax sp. GBBC 712]
MGQIVGSALVSHHPGLMQCEEFRRLQGAGEDSDLIAGFARLKTRIEAAQPDVVMIFDSHWFTTGYHLVDGGARYTGTYISDEMPWYLNGVPYDYRGHPGLALAIEAVSREQGGYNRAIRHPDLGRHYATVNLIKLLQLELSDIPVVTASSCQNCEWPHFLKSGEAIGEAIRRSDLRVVLLASGALSHKFNGIDWKPNHPRIFHESNVSSPENIESDKGAIALMAEGRHDKILERWDGEYRRKPWEAFGAHYLQMLGALGGAACRAKGEALSAYENARGTGNIHMWFPA